MSHLEMLDTFPNFLDFWEQAKNQPINVQIEGWANKYLGRYPELLAKQIADYSEQGLEWKTIAAERIFPFMRDRLPVMKEARKNLLAMAPSIYSKAQQVLEFDADVAFVIHVGIGCGAGWVTPFQGQPAILFGLENIAECGWSDAEAIHGLVAHEMGHVVHFHWRGQHQRTLPHDEHGWWQLYEEGFAQRCETLITGSDSWHESTNDDDWLDWCRSHKGWLAAEFLKTAEEGAPVNRFFGSWLEIEGKSETGYYLGYEAICELENEYTLKEIALLDDVEARFKNILEKMKAL